MDTPIWDETYKYTKEVKHAFLVVAGLYLQLHLYRR